MKNNHQVEINLKIKSKNVQQILSDCKQLTINLSSKLFNDIFEFWTWNDLVKERRNSVFTKRVALTTIRRLYFCIEIIVNCANTRISLIAKVLLVYQQHKTIHGLKELSMIKITELNFIAFWLCYEAEYSLK